VEGVVGARVGVVVEVVEAVSGNVSGWLGKTSRAPKPKPQNPNKKGEEGGHRIS